MRLRPQLSHNNLLTAIDLAYEAAEGHVGWEPFLHVLADSVGGRVTAFISHELSSAGGVVVNVRSDPEATRLYNDQWCHEDPWALSPRARTLAVPGRALVDEMLIPYREVQKTDYFRGYARKFGVARLLTVALAYDARIFRGLSITRAHDDGPFGADEIAFLQALAPHAQRASRLADLIGQSRTDADGARASLEVLPVGVIFLDPCGSLLHANAIARRLLAARDGLSIDRTGLCGATADVTAKLRALCAATAATSAGEGGSAGGPLSLPRPSGLASLQALVSPLRTPESFDLRRHRGGAMVFVSDPAADTPPGPAMLRAFYGFTPSESDVAMRLALGQSIEEVAAALGYTRDTVRWYSKQLLNKADCRSRAALVRRLSSTLLSLTGSPTAESRNK